MLNIYEKINQEAEKVAYKAIAWRRDIHAHPELGNQEIRTSKLVAEHLKKIGVDEVYEGLAGGTGVIGIIHGSKPGPIVGIRSDMDALPVKEDTGLPFASNEVQKWGNDVVPVMHGCGHDVHTALGMATADVICTLRDDLHGKVMFCFQPAEEGPPPEWKGMHGAQAMMAEEVFQKNKPEAMFALHVDPTQPVGSVGEISVAVGQTCMAISGFDIHLQGIGGHNAKPWQGVDTILPGTQVLQGLQNIVTRNVNPNTNNVVLTVGQFIGGTKYNVIADHTVISGACRFTDYATRTLLESRIEEVVKGASLSGQVQGKVIWNMHYPPNYNSAELIEKMLPQMDRVLGDNKYIVGNRGIHIADDFSFFTLEIPSIYGMLSCAPDAENDKEIGGLHNPKMIVNEKCFVPGIKALVTYAMLYDY